MPPDKFRRFQNAFKTKLLRNPDKINKTLDDFEQKSEGVLQNLLSPSERKVFRETADKIADINKSDIQKAIQRQEEFSPLIDDLVAGETQTGKTNAVFRVIQETGGKESPTGTLVRRGLVDKLVRQTVRETPDGQMVSTDKFRDVVSRWEERGLTKFLKEDDINAIRDLLQVAKFNDVPAEGVAGLLGATAVSQSFRLPPNPGAVMTLIRNAGVGRFITSKPGKFLLQGTAKGKKFDKGPFILGSQAVKQIFQDDANVGKAKDVEKARKEIEKRIQEAEQKRRLETKITR
jgi:hypothetical protein